MKVNKAVILAAGKGTRFMPYTKSMPKEMLAVIDKPALEIIIEEVIQAGISDIAVIISHEKEMVAKYFERDEQLQRQMESLGRGEYLESLNKIFDSAKITFFYQETPNGTARAVALAKEWADNQPFVVCNGDDVILNEDASVAKQLADAYEQVGASIIGVQPVSRQDIVKYASTKIIRSDGRLHLLEDIIEKPQKDEDIHSLLAPLGRYVVTADMFDYMDMTAENGKGELVLTDVLRTLMHNKPVYAYDFAGRRHDFGDKLGYIKGFTDYALHDERFAAAYKQYLTELLNKDNN